MVTQTHVFYFGQRVLTQTHTHSVSVEISGGCDNNLCVHVCVNTSFISQNHSLYGAGPLSSLNYSSACFHGNSCSVCVCVCDGLHQLIILYYYI